MKEFVFQLNETLKRGLALAKNKRNQPYLIKSVGMFPYDDTLVSVKRFTQIDTSVMGTMVFPYPQLFILSDVILVCGPTAIYEYDGTSLTMMIDGLTEQLPWTVIDFKSFICLSNGGVTVIKVPSSGAYKITSDYPLFKAGCDFHGQVVISPEGYYTPTTISGYLLDSHGNYILDSNGNKIPLS